MASCSYANPALTTSARAILRTRNALKATSRSGIRRYAQVGSTTFLGEPPSPPTPPGPPPAASKQDSSSAPNQPPNPFDQHVLSELRKAAAAQQPSLAQPTPLTELIDQYMKRAGHVMESALPYESRPGAERRVRFSDAPDKSVSEASSSADGALVVVAHAVLDSKSKEHKVAYSSGFFVQPPGTQDSEAVLVTCAHTLEEIRHNPIIRSGLPSPAVRPGDVLSGSFIINGPPNAPVFHPVASVLSAMHRADLLLLSASLAQPASEDGAPAKALRTLPVNPYPVHPGTPIRAHFVTDKPPAKGKDGEGWTPWVGGTWRKWVKGTVVGYRDFAGKEAKPGTYDSLAHLYFDPPPTPGSSGGPIVDEESGAVVGVILGTQLVNQLHGFRGWGVPAETIFEMFSLPGLNLKSRE
ncbi:hypothetical protein PYCCODRAFT_1431853 [Trametes coccinea BRFM310]|uniref:Trypsin-like serine protease n=1 Tax=Trametes coccinea (strain BRFM310) TaxID=1353009 RepID=A0A1Y2IZM1_TRAC3|nr:hypothetical protein PYCCODRAFT_1431853 [Trametes coccinea BRFM310]